MQPRVKSASFDWHRLAVLYLGVATLLWFAVVVTAFGG